jgi:hypothetical protein
VGQQGRLGVPTQPSSFLFLCVEELRQDSRDAAPCVLPHKLQKRLLGVVPFEQFGHFDRLGRFIKHRARWSDLQPSHHVAANDREQSNRAGSDVRPKLLLQDLQQVSLGQIHSKDG